MLAIETCELGVLWWMGGGHSMNASETEIGDAEVEAWVPEGSSHLVTYSLPV